MPAIKQQPKMQTPAIPGFSSVTSDAPKRLLVGSQGLPRTGKTDWAMRGTKGPIAYIGLDFGHEGVIEKHHAKGILAYVKNIPSVASQSEYLPIWVEVESRIKAAMDSPQIKTVILDSGSEIWELLRLAQFGTMNPRGRIQDLYPAVNAAYRSLIRSAYDSEKNLIVTHKVKKEYIKRTVMTQKGAVEQEIWEGGYERAGFGEGGYLIQCEIEHLFDQNRVVKGSKDPLMEKFGIRILNSRQNMGLAGLELWGAENNFPTLASLVFDNSPEDWL